MNIKSEYLTQSYERKNTVSKQHSQQKPFEELNLMDSFLFESATENPENAITISRIIIERVTGRKVSNLIVHSQKELKGINISKHGIRMDVYTEEVETTEEGTSVTCVYDIEPNNYYEPDIPRRDRYYQSMIDSKLLPTGEPYKKLPDMFSIWILSTDPFKDNRMVYTVKNVVAENNQIVYNDGVTKIFLYTKGTVGGSKELKELLTFMENSVRDNAVDKDLAEIMDIVDTVKRDSEERRRYMGIMNVIDYEKRDSYEDGRSNGLHEGIGKGQIHGVIQTCKSFGADREKAKDEIMKQFSISESDAKEYITLYWDKELTTIQA